MSDAGRPSACVQCKPKINSKEGETTLCVGRPLLLGSSHAGELLLSHSKHKSVNLPGLYEMLWKVGVGVEVCVCVCGGSCVHGGVGVYTLGTAVFAWLPSRPVLKPTPLTGIQVVSHAKKCECMRVYLCMSGGGGGVTLRLKRLVQAVTQLHCTPCSY